MCWADSFCQLDIKIESPWGRDSRVRNPLHPVGLGACLWGIAGWRSPGGQASSCCPLMLHFCLRVHTTAPFIPKVVWVLLLITATEAKQKLYAFVVIYCKYEFSINTFVCVSVCVCRERESNTQVSTHIHSYWGSKQGPFLVRQVLSH